MIVHKSNLMNKSLDKVTHQLSLHFMPLETISQKKSSCLPKNPLLIDSLQPLDLNLFDVMNNFVSALYVFCVYVVLLEFYVALFNSGCCVLTSLLLKLTRKMRERERKINFNKTKLDFAFTTWFTIEAPLLTWAFLKQDFLLENLRSSSSMWKSHNLFIILFLSFEL